MYSQKLRNVYIYELEIVWNLVKMSEFVINNSINVSKWNQIITFLVSKIKIAWKWAKKGDFENPKVINPDFSTKTVPE